ncbi:MAG TPA: PEP/pyruvate-binding domain-containing protein [Symbiobacteriaceae bacterium]|nr:PEP/pyruvate-binding domain-containing protein [Symbiobacteriaceae bacterium]
MKTSRLSEVSRADLAIAGGKGANLGEMLRLGLPVPPGFCVTAPAYAGQVAEWGLAGLLAPLLEQGDWDGVTAAAEQALRERPLAPDLEAAIRREYAELGEPAVAVRSSATAEDLADASFAGQQETFLNVRGGDALLQAVRECWASLWGQRAVHYRQQRQIDHLAVSMAVVVQVMVPAEAAGVMFTVDPVTRRSDRILIEAAPGLGEAVVSGDVTGDLYRLGRPAGGVVEREVRHAGRPVLSDGHLAELAVLGLRLEAHFGCPQDVEFALAGGKLYLLQSRPITTLAVEPEPVPDEPLDRMQRLMLKEGRERYPLAPKPLDNLFFGLMTEASINTLRLAGFHFEAADEKAMVAKVWRPIYASFPRSKPTWRLAGAMGRALRTLDRDWQGWWDGEPRRRLVEVTQPVAVQELSDAALLDRADAILAAWRQIFKERFEFAVALYAGSMLRSLVALAVGPGRAARVTDDLMLELPTRTSETNEALWRLSREARRNPADLEALAAGRFAEVSPGLRTQVDAFLAEYGHREGSTWYVSIPTWRQEPAQVWRLLAGLAAVAEAPHAPVGRRAAALEAVERKFRRIPWLLRRFRWLLERQRAMQTFRENSHFDLTRPLAALQELAAEWGRRLVQRGLFRAPDDVFYLTYDEVRQWLLGHGPAPAEAAQHIARRRETYKVVNGRWQSGQFDARATGGDLRGVPASAGVVRAKARIVTGEADWSRLQPGEVLVCPYTNPAWTPLFAVAAAVVTETGGAGAHAAIVAREYGIPAVMGVQGATRRIADGQEILVDGATGKVLLG